MKNNKRAQAPKPITSGRNQAWSEAVMEQSNRNLTRPGKNRYKREKAGARGRDW